jgi:hypothetical protein
MTMEHSCERKRLRGAGALARVGGIEKYDNKRNQCLKRMETARMAVA